MPLGTVELDRRLGDPALSRQAALWRYFVPRCPPVGRAADEGSRSEAPSTRSSWNLSWRPCGTELETSRKCVRGHLVPTTVMPSPLPASLVREFLATMPPAYRTAFAEQEILGHARVVLERSGTQAHVARTAAATEAGEAVLCIAADDRPGLLATISAALVLNELDVVRAEANTRVRADGKAEAVDLFWVRDVGSAPGERLSAAGIAQLEVTLNLLLDGRLDLEEVARRRGYAPPTMLGETRVRFLEGEGGGLAVLEVQTSDRTGLLLGLARALCKERVNIAHADVRTENGRVLDRFVVTEIGGAAIGSARRLRIQVAILGALQPMTERPLALAPQSITRQRPSGTRLVSRSRRASSAS
jgi:UTP:GlnB (protein PII) uridylyltransferase